MGLPLHPPSQDYTACVLLHLSAWPLRLGMPESGSRLEGGLIFPGFDVLIPQRSCLFRLRSAAASRLRFPHLLLRCQVRLRPWLSEETCPSLNLTVWVQRSPDGTTRLQCRAGSSQPWLPLPQSLASLSA